MDIEEGQETCSAMDMSPSSSDAADLLQRIANLSPNSAFRTEGKLIIVKRDDARHSLEDRKGCRKVLFRCSGGNEGDQAVQSPVQPVVRPTLWDHREWDNSLVDWGTLHTLSQIPQNTAKVIVENCEEIVENCEEMVEAYEDRYLAWSVECSTRVLEYVDELFVEKACNLEDDDLKDVIQERPGYLQLMRYLLRTYSSPHHIHIEKFLTDVEKEACKLHEKVEGFPSDPDELRIQMLYFAEAKDLRDSTTHMNFRTGGAPMLQRVTKMEKKVKNSELHHTMQKAKGVLEAGIFLMREKHLKKEAQALEAAANKIRNSSVAKRKLHKQKRIEVGVKPPKLEVTIKVKWGGDTLYLLGDVEELGNGDPTKAVPLFFNSGGWARSFKLQYDFTCRREISCCLILKSEHGFKEGPKFTLTEDHPSVEVVWDISPPENDELVTMTKENQVPNTKEEILKPMQAHTKENQFPSTIKEEVMKPMQAQAKENQLPR